MGEDEDGTLARLRAHRSELIDPMIGQHGGRIVKTMGDGLLLEFAEATAAVRCALAIQEGMAARNEGMPEERRIVFRIGINLSEVVVEDGDIYGDGVNLTARLEAMAEPGGLLVSEALHDAVGDGLEVAFADSGKRTFKNIANPVRVWSWPRPLPETRENRKPFVAVAKFDGGREEERRLAEDLRDDLTAALARLTGLEVTLDRRKADYLIQGGVRLAGGRSRISAQLIRVEDDGQLWAERYKEDTDDSFEILDHCIPSLIMNVRRHIAADDAARVLQKNLDEMTLEQLLPVAGVSFFTPTKEGWLGGGRIAELALAKEPDNFMALAMAAAGFGLVEYYYGYQAPDQAVLDLAFKRVEAAERQTNKSDMLACVRGGLLIYGRGQIDEGAAAAEWALQLNPDFNMGFWLLGAAQAFAGDYLAAADTAERAVNIDIRDPYVHLYSRVAGYGYFGAEDYPLAAEWFGKADQLAPGLPHNLIGLAASLSLNAQRGSAQDSIERLLGTEPNFHLSDMYALPFRDTAVLRRLQGALREAGVPE